MTSQGRPINYTPQRVQTRSKGLLSEINSQSHTDENAEDIITNISEIRFEERETQIVHSASTNTEPVQVQRMATMKLKRFNGSESPITWLSHLDAWQRLTSKNDAETMLTVACSLDGTALTWFQTLSEEQRRCIDSFSNALKTRFNPPSNTMSMLRIKQEDGETVEKYLERAESASLAHDLPEEYKVQFAVNGLKKNMMGKVFSREPKTFQELRHAVNLVKTEIDCSESDKSAPLSAGSMAELCAVLTAKMREVAREEVNTVSNNSNEMNPPFQNRQYQGHQGFSRPRPRAPMNRPGSGTGSVNEPCCGNGVLVISEQGIDLGSIMNFSAHLPSILVSWSLDFRPLGVFSIYMDEQDISRGIQNLLNHLKWSYIQVMVQESTRYLNILNYLNSNLTSEFDFICGLNKRVFDSSVSDADLEIYLKSLMNEAHTKGVLVLVEHFILRRISSIWKRIGLAVEDFFFVVLADIDTFYSKFDWPMGWIFIGEVITPIPVPHIVNTSVLDNHNLSDYSKKSLWNMLSVLQEVNFENCSHIHCLRNTSKISFSSLFPPAYNQIHNHSEGWVSIVNTSEFSHKARFYSSNGNSVLDSIPASFSLPLRTECKNPLIKPVIVSQGHEDAYVIAVLPIHEAAITQTGCDRNKVFTRSKYLGRAFEFAVNILNEDRNGTRFGFVLLDSCANPDRIKFLIEGLISSGQVPLSRIVGTVGFPLDEEFSGTAKYLEDKGLTTVSIAASSDVFSDKETYPYFLRMVAPNAVEASVILNLIMSLNFTNVGFIYSADNFGIEMTRDSIRILEENMINVLFALKIEDTYLSQTSALEYLVKKILLKSIHKVQAIIAFCRPLHFTAIFNIVKAQNITEIFWIISNTQYRTIDKRYFIQNIEYSNNSIILSRNLSTSSSFMQYSSDIFAEMNTLEISEGNNISCAGFEFDQNCSSVNMEVGDRAIVDSVLTLGNGIKYVIRKHSHDNRLCFEAQAQKPNLPELLCSLTFMNADGKEIQFDSKGNGLDSLVIQQLQHKDNVELVQIGSYDDETFRLDVSTITIPFFAAEGYHCDDCLILPKNVVDWKLFYKEGDLMVGAFLEMYRKNFDNNFCSERFNEEGFQAFTAIKWSIDKINNDDTILPGIKLGYFVIETCMEEAEKKVLAALSPSVILPQLPLIPRDIPLVGVLGESIDPIAIATERSLRRINPDVPMFVPSGVQVFNDRVSHPGIFRTTIPVNEYTSFVLQLLVMLDWTYVHAVYNMVNKPIMDDLSAKAKNLGICFATTNPVDMSNQRETIGEGIDKMLAADGAVGVVVLLPAPAVRVLLSMSVEKKTKGKLVYVLSSEIDDIDEVVEGSREAALGLVTAKLNFTDNPVFARYFKELSYKSNKDLTWMDDFWESHFHCNLRTSSDYDKNCRPELSLMSEAIKQTTMVTKNINAVYILAKGLNTIFKACNQSWETCVKLPDFYDRLKRTLDRTTVTPPGGDKFSLSNRNATMVMTIYNLQLDPNGRARFLTVGTYERGKLTMNLRKLSMYKDGSRTLFPSKCPGRCSACMSTDFVEQYNARVMELTSDGPPRINEITQALGVITFLLVAIGLIFAVMIVYYIYKYASHKIFNICVDAHVCIIFGTVLQLGASFMYLFSPTPLVCAIQQAIPGCVYSVCYAGMLIKLNKTACLRDVVGTNQIRVPRWDFAVSYLPVMVAAPVMIYVAWVLEDLPDVEWVATDIHDVTNVEDVVVKWSCKINTTKYLVFMSFFWIIIVTCLIMSLYYLISSNKQPEVKQVLWSSIITSAFSAVETCLSILLHDDTFRTVTSALLPVNAIAILLINFLPSIVTLMKEDYEELRFRELMTRHRAKTLGDIWKVKNVSHEKKADIKGTKTDVKKKTSTKKAASLWKANIKKQHSKHIVEGEASNKTSEEMSTADIEMTTKVVSETQPLP